jgi:hypothetical protein
MNFVTALTAYAMPWSDTFGLAGSERRIGQAATQSIRPHSMLWPWRF